MRVESVYSAVALVKHALLTNTVPNFGVASSDTVTRIDSVAPVSHAAFGDAILGNATQLEDATFQSASSFTATPNIDAIASVTAATSSAQVNIVPITLAIVIIAIAAIALVVWLLGTKRRKLAQELQQRHHAPFTYAFILNPSKPTAADARAHIEQFFSQHTVGRAVFYETQLDKDGKACAQEALEAGADAVIAVGGDGTVRTAASAVAGTERPFGIIPIGTGNLFARNMGIPIGDIEAALLVATSHGSRRVDMGRMRLLDSEEPQRGHAFLIIAGIGFDADMIDSTDPDLKRSISWLAYFASGVKHLFSPKYHGDLEITSADGSKHTSTNITFRTLMAGNCGQIPGFSLMPDAAFDDGILNFEIIDTTGGIIGWANLFGDVLTQTITHKSGQNPLSTNSSVDQIQGVRAEITLQEPALAQVDGDILGKTSHIEFTIEPKALWVRVPAATTDTQPNTTHQETEQVEQTQEKHPIGTATITSTVDETSLPDPADSDDQETQTRDA